jgi:hypothetical protein
MPPLIRTLWHESATSPPSSCSNVNSSAILDQRTRIRRSSFVCFSFFVGIHTFAARCCMQREQLATRVIHRVVCKNLRSSFQLFNQTHFARGRANPFTCAAETFQMRGRT